MYLESLDVKRVCTWSGRIAYVQSIHRKRAYTQRVCVSIEQTLRVVKVWVQSVSRECMCKESMYMECKSRFYREYT